MAKSVEKTFTSSSSVTAIIASALETPASSNNSVSSASPLSIIFCSNKVFTISSDLLKLLSIILHIIFGNFFYIIFIKFKPILPAPMIMTFLVSSDFIPNTLNALPSSESLTEKYISSPG